MAEIEALPGTPFWVIRGDNVHSLKAHASGTIVTETELLTIPEMNEITPPGGVVLDCGAYVGDTARFFLDRGCTVHAFEPFADAFKCLQLNCPEAQHYNTAVGDGREAALRPEFSDVYEHLQGNYGTRGLSPGCGMKTLAIDTLSLQRVDLVKLDVEGFEAAALDGMRRTLELHRPAILIEVFDSMLAKFDTTDDDLIRRMPEGYTHRTCVGIDTDDRRDWLCWPREKFPSW